MTHVAACYTTGNSSTILNKGDVAYGTLIEQVLHSYVQPKFNMWKEEWKSKRINVRKKKKTCLGGASRGWIKTSWEGGTPSSFATRTMATSL